MYGMIALCEMFRQIEPKLKYLEFVQYRTWKYCRCRIRKISQGFQFSIDVFKCVKYFKLQLKLVILCWKTWHPVHLAQFHPYSLVAFIYHLFPLNLHLYEQSGTICPSQISSSLQEPIIKMSRRDLRKMREAFFGLSFHYLVNRGMKWSWLP